MLTNYLRLPRAVHLLCLGTFINRAGTFVIIYLSLYLTTNLHLGVTFATRTIGLFGLGTLLAAASGGHLADRIGRRVVMLVALLGGGTVLIALRYATAPWLIMLLVPLFGIIGEMYRPAAGAMIADLTTPQQRPHAYSLMYVSINLGFALGAYVGGLLADLDFHWLFWGDALTSALYALLILTFIRETLPARRAAPASEAAAQPALPPLGNTPPPSAFRQILANRPFVVFCLGNFFIALVFMQFMSTFPVFLQERGFTSHQYGRVIALNGMLIVLFQLPMTSVLNRFHRGSVVALGAVLHGIGFGINGLLVTLWQFAGATIIWTLGEMCQAAYGQAIVSDFAPAHLRGRYLGVYGMSFSCAMMLAAPLGGEILGRPSLGGKVLWSGTFILALISTGLYLSIHRHLAAKKATPNP